LAALCHDIGTSISYENHAAIAAEILRPYVSPDVYQIVRTHQDFQRRHYHEKFGRRVDARGPYAREPWFQDAERFSDEWDQLSFDPKYETLPLKYFFQMIDAVFAKPLPWDVKKPGNAADRSTASSRWLKSIQNFVRGGGPD
jgi:predicted HD phosphohydrolase